MCTSPVLNNGRVDHDRGASAKYTSARKDANSVNRPIPTTTHLFVWQWRHHHDDTAVEFFCNHLF